ncbi:DNA polymerase epsilon subunit 2 [Metschnikowia aff. pulcherrima]|uniref:DNA polymerase epsilon subunit B n=1 Tax=Metschnikowia aff. pulcherrima TaxID=2163413 RepID=A0A4P6XLG9_9ASCO|nr:DNA polymerase epsilon subunit 2 [Metschnikowia aff. pulcherrima]
MPGPTLLPVKLQPSNVRPIAYRVLSKKHGLNIQSDALLVLTELFSTRFGAEWRGPLGQQFLEDFAKLWKKQDRGLFIDGPGCSQVIKEITKEQATRQLTMGSGAIRAAKTDTFADEPEASDVPREVMDWRHFVLFVTPDMQPNFHFDRIRKQFSPRDKAGKKLRPALRASLEYFSQRYFLLADRMSRDENFQKTSFSSIAAINHTLANQPQKGEITLIKNVLGRDGNKFRLFGLLLKNMNGNLVLEDSSDHIELNVTRAEKFKGSFFCPGMFVIVDGIYSASGGSRANDGDVISGCFHVSVISQPVAETRDLAMDAYGHLDFLGIHNDAKLAGLSLVKIDRALRRKLVALEKTLHGHRLILLGSNVFLDDLKVRAGLQKFFAKLEDQIHDLDQADAGNITVVMTGSFASQALTSAKGSVTAISNSEEYKANFDWLAEMLAKFPLVVNTCKLLLIPGANDPWQSTYSLGKPGSSTLPQTPIPKVFVTRLERLFPRGSLILGWNPMRINYISQEIVLFRDDLMTKLKRNDIVFESDLEFERMQLEREARGEDQNVENIIGDEVHLSAKIRQARKLVKTLLDQGNLQPFLKDLRLVSPNYLHVMRIEPLPNTIALFDSKFESFEVTYNGCKMTNLGSFISNKNNRKLNYAEYSPSTKKYAYKEIHF